MCCAYYISPLLYLFYSIRVILHFCFIIAFYPYIFLYSIPRLLCIPFLNFLVFYFLGRTILSPTHIFKYGGGCTVNAAQGVFIYYISM